MATDSIPARLLARARTSGERPAYWVRSGETWRPTTWATYAGEVREACRALIALGVRPGDRTCILGFNRPEWVIFDVATMMAGGAPAGIYTTCSPPEVAYIVDHADAAVVLVENEAQWEKLRTQRDHLPKLRHVVSMRGAEVSDPIVLPWAAFLARGASVGDAEVDERIDAIRPDDVATIIYTSGTTGPPKGVMLSTRNLAWTASLAQRLTDVTEHDTSLSYLPLAHIAEQMFSIHAPITAGSSIHFAESLEKMADNLREVQPTTVFGVPRVWEKMHAKVAPKLAEATGLKRRVVDFALAVGREHTGVRNRGERPSVGLRARHRLADRLLFRKLKPMLGLGRARVCVTGAAPISREVLEFFAGLDVPLLEVYGQSEDTGPTSFNVPGRTRFGTVGKPVPDTQVRIAEDGEILVKGPHVFLGYAKDPVATAEVLVDGWLRTGDLGAFDADGYLTITGRKKEILITSGGKNIAPAPIEAALQELSLVSQAVLIGDRRHFVAALVTLDPEAAAAFARERALPTDGLHGHPAVVAEIGRGIDEIVNPRLARVEQVRKFTVLPRELSLEAGELTPTLKLKRKVALANWASEIEAMYTESRAEPARASAGAT